MTGFVLSRNMLLKDGLHAMVVRDAPTQRLLTKEQRIASLNAILARKPPGDAWLFGYGSLIWNPTLQSVEHRTAWIAGWHRAFCLSVQAGRGSPENPGLVLGLEAGGTCAGVAYRLDQDVLRAELELIWRREMLSGAYVPQWVDIFDQRGTRFGSAIAFTIDSTGPCYAGNLTETEVVRRLASASGALGSSADYLFRTRDGLRAHGIEDTELERLAIDVNEELAARR